MRRYSVLAFATLLALVAVSALSAEASTEPRGFARAVSLAPSTQSVKPPRARSTRLSAFAMARHGCSSGKRAVRDRVDVAPGPLVHILYLVPTDARDMSIDFNGVLDCSVMAQMEWFREASDGLEWRLDTYHRGRAELVDVTYVATEKTRAELAGAFDVMDELRILGFADEDKRYLTYVQSGDGTGLCGDAIYPINASEDPVDGKYAQVYLESIAECRATEFGVPGKPSFSETIAQQELIHNDGMVPIGAPHNCWTASLVGHVCTPGLGLTQLDPETADVMFPYVGLPLSQKQLDPGNDDYFRHLLPIRDLQGSIYLRESNHPVSR